MSWSEVPLNKVADLESGFGFPREQQGDSNQEFPFFRVSDMNLDGNEVFMSNYTNTVSRETLGRLHARAFPAGTVIFPKIGAAIATGKKRVLTKPATFDNNVMGAVPRSCVEPKFLYYWFLRLNLSDCANDSHVPSIRKSVMEKISFELPPPTEQRRIVEILDQADSLRKLRREADAKAARILPALFLKMFGDPATNPMGWPVKPLSKAIDHIEAGWSARSEMRERQPGEFGVLKVSAVTSGRFLPEEYKTVASVPSSQTLVTPKRGDLLFSRANTRELVAATCLVDADYPYLFLPDKLWRLLPRKDIATTPYLRELMACEVVRDKFRAFSSGSSGSMLNVSQTAVLRTEVPLAPRDLQMTFERYTWEVLGLLRTIHQAHTRLETLRTTLLQRAFSSQLTAKWRMAHMQELLTEMREQARLLGLPMPAAAAQ